MAQTPAGKEHYGELQHAGLHAVSTKQEKSMNKWSDNHFEDPPAELKQLFCAGTENVLFSDSGESAHVTFRRGCFIV